MDHYKQITELISEIEQIESEINKKKRFTNDEKQEKEAALPPSSRPQQLKLSEFQSNDKDIPQYLEKCRNQS